MKRAFLVVSDLHRSGHSKTNRHSYDGELQIVYRKIADLIAIYEENGHVVSIIFLGDIFDKSYKSPEKHGVDSSFFTKLKEMTAGLFAVVGNHELNFYFNNPFWTLISENRSTRLSSLTHVNTQPLGYTDTFFVMDQFEVGDCVFHFNHFGCEDSPSIAGKTNLAFYHKPLYNNIMLDNAEMNGIPVAYARNLPTVPISTVCKYDYAFLGHMHWLYGTWKLDNTTIYGLSSLGRPNKAEVSNSFLERNIPAVLLEDDIFVKVEDNLFTLPTREASIVKEIDEAQKEDYELLKRQVEAKKYISTTDDPIHNIKTYLVDNTRAASLLDALLNKTYTDAELTTRIFDIERRAKL